MFVSVIISIVWKVRGFGVLLQNLGSVAQHLETPTQKASSVTLC